MLTNEDIIKLSKVLATNEDIKDVKSDIVRLENKVDKLQTSVDNLGKMVKTFQEEHIIMRKRLETLETWAKKVSEKLGIPLPF